MFNIKNILNPGGIAYISFDGIEEGNKDEFVVFDNGTRKYIIGERKGMLWRFYPNEEIKILCTDMEILEFIEKDNGIRELWVGKK
jgi:hypothetical protein